MTDPDTTHVAAIDTTSLSDELRGVVAAADGKPMSVGQILDHLQDRGTDLFIIIVSFPFILLPTTFGLSAPIGLAVAILAGCQMLGRRPWLPKFIMRREFPFESLQKTLNGAAKWSARVERIARPRLTFLLWPGFNKLAYFNLIIWGLLLGCPGPNNLFAAMILLLAFGLLMRDGLLLLIAHVLTFTAPILAFIYWDSIVAIFMATWDKVAGLFT